MIYIEKILNMNVILVLLSDKYLTCYEKNTSLVKKGGSGVKVAKILLRNFY